MTPANRDVLAHLTLALARYLPEAEVEARREGRTVPDELLTIANFLADCVRTRQGATPGADAGTGPQPVVMADGLVLTKREVATLLRRSVRTVERILADPDSGLSAVTVGGATRVRRADVEAYVAGLGGAARGTSFRDDIQSKESA